MVWHPEAPGSYTFHVMASDGHGGQTQQDFTVVVYADAANALSIPDAVQLPDAEAGRKYTYTIIASDADGDAVRYYLADECLAKGMTIGRNTGVLKWYPPEVPGNQPYDEQVKVLVSDGRNPSVEMVLSLHVKARTLLVNTRPEFTCQPLAIAVVNETYRYQVTATDVDHDPLVYSIAIGPDGMAIDPELGIVTWDPYMYVDPTGRVLEDNFEVVVCAEDGQSSAFLPYWIKVFPRNYAPMATVVWPLVRTLGQSIVVPLGVYDPNGDEVTVTLDPGSRDRGMFVNDHYELEWPTDRQQVGDFPVFLWLDDNRGRTVSHSLLLSVATDGCPRIQSQPMLRAVVGERYEYAVIASEDGVTYDMDFDSRDRGMAFGLEGLSCNVLVWRPTCAGEFPVTIWVDDGTSTDSQDFVIRVVEANHPNEPPEVVSTPGNPAARNLPYHYDVFVEDFENDPVVLSLVKPSNLSQAEFDRIQFFQAEPGHYVMRWTPTVSGIFEFAIQSGSTVLERFPLIVLDNTPPYVASFDEQPTISATNLLSFKIKAVDPNPEDSVTCSLDALSRAVGMTGPDANGWVTLQLPSDAEPGWYQYPMEITTTDNHGASLSKTLLLAACKFESTNEPPTVEYSIPDRVPVGQLFEGQVRAADPENDSLQYSVAPLDTLPAAMQAQLATMQINGQGWITWRPSVVSTPTQPYVFEVRVSDGVNTISQQFTVHVVHDLTNIPPQITSVPVGFAVANIPYFYEAEAVDRDMQPLRWSLDQAPEGMTVDEQTGVVSWTPTFEQASETPYSVILRVTDTRGGSDTQEIRIRVTGTNQAPQVTLSPPDLVVAGASYQFKVDVRDPEGHPIRYRIVSPDPLPAGMTLQPADPPETDGTVHLVFRWNSAVSPTGQCPYTYKDAAIEVLDAFGQGVLSTFDINIVQTEWNHAPLIQPILTQEQCIAIVGWQDFDYTFRATDEDGDEMDVLLPVKPDNMTISTDPATGLTTVHWKPQGSEVPPPGVTPYPMYPVRIVVADRSEFRLKASLNFSIIVVPEGSPQIDPIPSQYLLRNTPLELPVLARPATGCDMPLKYELIGAPAGMTIDASSGDVAWAGSPVEMESSVTVRVTDRWGRYNDGGFFLRVSQDTQAPNVDIKFSRSPVEPGSRVTVQVVATDKTGIRSRTLYQLVTGRDPIALPLDSEGRCLIDVPMGQTGQLEFTATATDVMGNTSPSVSAAVAIWSPMAGTPAAVIDLAEGAMVSSPSDIMGTVYDDDLASWSLSIASDEGGTTELASGTQPIASGKLSWFDPTVMANGAYTLTLHAIDQAGHSATCTRPINLDGKLKLGNLNLSFVDLEVPLAGIPITITRNYDSLRARTSSEFGYGWRLGLGTTTLAVHMAGDTTLGWGNVAPFRANSRVVVSLPDGSTAGFTFKPYMASTDCGPNLNASIASRTYAPYFEPDPGVKDQLRVDLRTPVYLQRFDGSQESEFFVMDSGEMVSYNPADPRCGPREFYLVRPSGEVLTLDAVTGKLKQRGDRNGNSLTYTDDAITSSTGYSVSIVRQDNRITQIVLPDSTPENSSDNPRIVYSYDTQGNLVSVTDRSDKITRFEYNADGTHGYTKDMPHYLTDIFDGRGVNALHVEYRESDGRIESISDAALNALGFGFNLELADGRFVETTTTGGRRVETLRDRDGNVVRKVEQIEVAGPPLTYHYLVTVYDYRDGHMTGESFPFTVTAPQVDPCQPGDAAHRFNAAPAAWKTQTTYENDRPVSIIDALGNTTYYTYDAKGNLLATVDPLGNSTQRSYDEWGNLDEILDAQRRSTRFEYDPVQHGLLTSVVDPSGVVVSRFEYDAYGRMTATIDAAGFTRWTVYDAAGNPTLSYHHAADAASNPRTIVARSNYDAEGRVQSTSQYELDGPLTFLSASQLDAYTPLWTTSTTYDDAGQAVATVDADNLTTSTAYDPRGLVTETRRAIEPNSAARLVVRTFYDELGRAEFTTDEYLDPGTGPTDTVWGTQTCYDALGRVVETRRVKNLVIEIDSGTHEASPPSGYTVVSHSETHYDSTGQVDHTVDEFGTATYFRYDAAGRQIERRTQVRDDRDPSGTLHWLVTRTVFDAAGQPVATSDAYVDGDGVALPAAVSPAVLGTASVYDSSGRVVQPQRLQDLVIEIADTPQGLQSTVRSCGAIVWTSESIYDSSGRLRSPWRATHPVPRCRHSLRVRSPDRPACRGADSFGLRPQRGGAGVPPPRAVLRRGGPSGPRARQPPSGPAGRQPDRCFGRTGNPL